MEKSFKFRLVVKKISCLSEQLDHVYLKHPGNKTPVLVQVSEGTVNCSIVSEIVKPYSKEEDDESFFAFRIVTREKKISRCYINVETLRQHFIQKGIKDTANTLLTFAMNDYDSVESKTLISLTFKCTEITDSDSGLINNNKYQSININSKLEVCPKPIVVKLKPGKLGATFATVLIPPTITKISTEKDSFVSPLLGKVPIRSVLVRVNDIDTSKWNVARLVAYFKSLENETIAHHTLVFIPPPTFIPSSVFESQVSVCLEEENSQNKKLLFTWSRSSSSQESSTDQDFHHDLNDPLTKTIKEEA
eukprot:c16318_g1_i2.p1 GENE.c16318_g1_i2~~c16318_g1_i2.p1  ORF type:complete len:315 (-),score=63.40 c16318_g1_i2:96-1010(-)